MPKGYAVDGDFTWTISSATSIACVTNRYYRFIFWCSSKNCMIESFSHSTNTLVYIRKNSVKRTIVYCTVYRYNVYYICNNERPRQHFIENIIYLFVCSELKTVFWLVFQSQLRTVTAEPLSGRCERALITIIIAVVEHYFCI